MIKVSRQDCKRVCHCCLVAPVPIFCTVLLVSVWEFTFVGMLPKTEGPGWLQYTPKLRLRPISPNLCNVWAACGSLTPRISTNAAQPPHEVRRMRLNVVSQERLDDMALFLTFTFRLRNSAFRFGQCTFPTGDGMLFDSVVLKIPRNVLLHADCAFSVGLAFEPFRLRPAAENRVSVENTVCEFPDITLL